MTPDVNIPHVISDQAQQLIVAAAAAGEDAAAIQQVVDHCTTADLVLPLALARCQCPLMEAAIVRWAKQSKSHQQLHDFFVVAVQHAARDQDSAALIRLDAHAHQNGFPSPQLSREVGHWLVQFQPQNPVLDGILERVPPHDMLLGQWRAIQEQSGKYNAASLEDLGLRYLTHRESRGVLMGFLDTLSYMAPEMPRLAQALDAVKRQTEASSLRPSQGRRCKRT